MKKITQFDSLLKTHTRLLGVLGLILLFSTPSVAAEFSSAASGNWSASATWTIVSGTDADGIPDADDNVTISHEILLDNDLVIPIGETFTCTVGSGGALSGEGIINVAGTFIKEGEGYCALFINYSGTVKLMTDATLILRSSIGTGVLENHGHVTLSGFPDACQLADYLGNGIITVIGYLQINMFGGLNYTNAIFNFHNGTNNYILGPINFVGTTQQTIAGNGTLGRLLINNANGVTISGSLTISDNLNFANGNIFLQNNDLEIGSVGSISNASSSNFIVTQSTGRLLQTIGTTFIIFPIGPDATSYNPVTLTQATGTAKFGANVKIGLDNDKPLNKILYVNRQWTVDNISGTPNATFGLTWLGPTHEIGTISDYSWALDYPYIHRWDGTVWVKTPLNESLTSEYGIYPHKHTAYQLGWTQFPSQFVMSSCIPPPPSVSNITYCQNETALALTATGSNLLWYTSTTGGTGTATAPIPSTATAGTTSYFVSQTEDCESARTEIQVLVKPLPAAPSVSNLSYCQNETAVALIATGSNLLWYNALTGGTGSTTAPTPSTATVGTSLYFVSRTVNNCESPRAEIQVTINAAPPHPSVSDVSYCQNAMAARLTATGSNLLWYDAATGGTGKTTAPIPSTTTVGTTSYFVSKTVNGCESPRSQIQVTINAIPSSPSVSNVSYCQNATATPLTVTGTNLIWYATATVGIGYTTAPTPSTTSVGTTSYFVNQTVNGCESPRSEIQVTVNATPTAPSVSNVNYCTNAIAMALSATGSNLLWYTTSTGGTGSATAPTPSTTSAGTTSYFVSQTVNGCESPRSEIQVTVNVIPAPPAVSNVSYCQNAIAMALSATGSNLLWYTSSTGGIGSATAPTPSTTSAGTTSYFVSQTVNGCESARAEIQVLVNPLPITTITGATTICAGSSTTLTASSGATYVWSTGATTSSISVNAAGTYTVTATDANGCTATASKTITVNPLLTASISTTSTACSTTLTASGGVTYIWSTGATTPSVTVSLSGTYTVTATDANGCTATASQTVTGFTSSPATFVSKANGNWNNANTWQLTSGSDCDGIPDADDNVTIALNHTISLDIAPTIVSLTMSNGAISGANAMTITGNLSISNGIFAPEGAVISGTLLWAGGTIGVASSPSVTDVIINGAATLSTGPRALNKRRLRLNGGGTWTAGDISISNGGIFEIPVNQTLIYNSASNLFFNGISGSGNNIVEVKGTLIKQGTGTLAASGLPFNNTGTVNVTSGILSLNTGSTSTGTFNIDSNDGLKFVGGTTHILNGATISGTGSMLTTATNLNAVGAYSSTISKTTISGGTFNGDATMNLTGNLVISGGTFAPVGTATIGGTLTWTNGNIGVSTSPSVSEVIINGVTTTIGGSIYRRKLILNGGGSWTPTNAIGIYNSGILEIPVGQTFTYNSTNSNRITTSNIGSVDVKGSFSKSGTGTLTLEVPINNTGLVTTTGGIFYMTAGGTSSGNFNSEVTNGIYFIGNSVVSYTFLQDAAFSGTGSINLASPINATGTSFNSTVTNLNITAYTFLLAGTFNHSGNLSVSGIFAPLGTTTINGNLTMNGASIGSSTAPSVTDFTVDGLATFTVPAGSGFDNQILKKRIVLNSGGTWTGGRMWVRNGSIFEIPVGQTLTYNSSSSTNFENDAGTSVEVKGTLRKIGTGNLRMGTPNAIFNILLNNTGSILVDQGAFEINSPYSGEGSIAVASGTSLYISTPSGLNYLNPIFVNNGTVNGTLALIFNGSVPQTLTGNGTINNLTLNNANDLVISGAQTISTALTFTNGKILLQNGDLTIGASGSIASASSTKFVVTQGTGRLVQSVPTSPAKIFPIGSDANSYNPVSLQQTGGTATFGAKVKLGLDNTLNKIGYVNRQWTVENISGTPNATLGLSWVSPTHETGTFSTSDNRLYRWNGTAWVSASISGAATPASGVYTRTQSGLTQFSQFVVSSCIPPAPSVSNVVYCQNDVATALTAIGTNLLWYTSATGGTGSTTAPTPSTTTAGTTSYFVSQTDDCESARAEIQVLVKPLPVSPSVSNVSYCQNEVATVLTATGTSLLWYTASTGGTGSATAPTPSTTSAGTTSYFVSQTVNGCESPRSEIQVTVNALPTAPSVSNVSYCQNEVATALTATGTSLLWYTVSTGGTGSATAPTPSITSAGTTSYFVSQTVNGCESARAEIQVLVKPLPTAPSVSNVSYCQNEVATALTATGTSLLWYTVSTGGTGSATAPTPSTTSAGTTSYFVSQTVNGCESPRSEIQVTVNALPIVSIIGLNASYCQSTVSITLGGLPTGGTFTIDGNAATSFVLSELSVGNHTVVYSVTENGCTNSASQTVTINALPTVSIVGLNANYCQGAASVTLAGLPTGGSFTIDGSSATSFDPSVLSVGNHTVVYSATENGCKNSASQTVTITNSSTATITNLNSSYCQNETGVTLTATPTGGTFTIDGNAATVFNPSVLSVGNHTVAYSVNQSGCISSASQVVEVKSVPSVSITGLNTTYCQSAANIPLTGIPSGGTFTIDGNTATALNPLALSAGIHIVAYTATGGSGCANTVQQSVTILAAPQFTMAATQILCFGIKSTITITPTNGATNQFSYSINGGTTFVFTNVFTNVAAGTYSIVVKNLATMCTTQQNLTILQPSAALAATVTKTNITCTDANDGQISVAPTGGTSPYQISFEGGAYQPNNVITGLAAGSYNLIVKDANGCVLAKNNNVITNPTVVNLALSLTTNILCNGSATGSIVVAATGGTTGTRQYSKNGGTTWQPSATFTALTAGTYQIISKDVNGCLSNIVSATLTQPDALVAVVAKTNLTCNASADGTITITATGGVSPDSFSINNGAKYFLSNTFTGLAAGNYNVRVKDANKCVTANQVITLTQPTVPTFTTTQTNITCNGLTNGSITFATATGGNGAPFQYSIDNGTTWQTTNVFSGLAIGSYDAKVKDVNGCQSVAKVVTITQPLAVSLTITSSTNILCNGAATGKIVVAATGGTGTKQYSKDGGTTWQPSATFSALVAGTYQMVSKDANGCLSNVQTVELTQPTPLSFTIEKTNLNCNLSADGTITITAAGGVLPYNYSINNGVAYVLTNSFTGLTAANYNVRVKDANGCVAATQAVALTQPTVVNATAAVTNLTCNGSADGKITISNPTGGTGAPYEYSKDNGVTWQTGLIFTGLTSGIYNVRIKSATGCLSAVKILTVTEPAPITFTLSKQDATCGSNNGVVAVSISSGGTPAYQYSKNGGTSFQTGNTFLNLAAATYLIRVKDSKNCLSAIQSIDISNGCQPLPFVQIGTRQETHILNFDFILSPNPAQSDITIDYKLDEKTDVTLELMDINGHSVWTKKVENTLEGFEKVNIRDYPTGVYFVKVAPLGNELKIKRLVITK